MSIEVKHVSKCSGEELRDFPELYKTSRPWLVIEDGMRAAACASEEEAQEALEKIKRLNYLADLVEERIDEVISRIVSHGYTISEVKIAIREYL
jgi:uncharacterized protein YoaH (UPF0181 family)